MKKLKKADCIIILVLLLLIAGAVFLIIRGGSEKSSGSKGENIAAPAAQVQKEITYSDYNGKKLGIVNGSSFEPVTLDKFPDSEYFYYNNTNDMLLALEKGTIDGFVNDEPVMRVICQENKNIAYLDELIAKEDYAVAFTKNNEKCDKLKAQFDEFLAETKKDGTYDEINDIWFGADESRKVLDHTGFSGEKITVGTSSSVMPFSYIKDGNMIGYSIDFIYRFCRKYGYTPVIEDTDPAGMIAGTASNKYDLAATALAVTEERKETMNFSEPYYNGGLVFAVRASDLGASSSAAANGEPPYTAYVGKRLGIKTGSSFEPVTLEMFPDSEYLYFDSLSDLITALKNDKIDAFIEDEPTLRMACNELKDINYLKKVLKEDKYRFGFQKGTEKSLKLQQEFNALIEELDSQGELDRMQEKWLGKDESLKDLDDSGLTGENGELLIAVNPDKAPFSYMAGSKLEGYSVELITLFARKYGYSLRFEYGNLAACIAGLSTGKYDAIAGCLSVTEERKKSMDFSDSIYDGGYVLAVRSSDLVGTSAEAEPQESPAPVQKEISIADYADKKIGVQTGTTFDAMIREKLPTAEVNYFNSCTDLLMALNAGTIDAFGIDEPVVKKMMSQDGNVDYLHEYMDEYEFGFSFGKDSRGEELCGKMSDLIRKMKSDGTLREIEDLWFGSDESKQVLPPLSSLSGGNGKLKLALESANAPFVYLQGSDIIGYEIDIAYRFCTEYGYELELVDMNFDAIIPAVTSGKCDFGCSGMTITEERAQSVNFSESDYMGGAVLAVRKADIMQSSAPAQPVGKSYTDFNGRRMGIRTGSSFEPITLEYFPDSEYYYYDSDSDLIVALQSGKIDAFLDDEPVAAMIHQAQSDVDYIKDPIMDDDYHFGFQKGNERAEKLKSEFNEVLAELISSGELEKMKDKWINGPESGKTYDDSGLTGENGNLTVAVVPDNVPFSYTANNKLEGYAVELVTIFARKYGYSIDFEQANTAGCIAGLTSGKYDIFAFSLSYTEERAKSMDFSEVIYNGGVMLMARASDLSTGSSGAVSDKLFKTAASETEQQKNSENQSWIDSIKESFNKNFIREDRYKLILEGIGTTCIITALSTVFGSLLAFLISMFRRMDSVLAGKIANIYVKILQGTPMVVLLMILYYVIFGKSGLAAMWVAVIGFSLNFGAYVSEILRSGIESIDGGQREAALALGYTENQAFFRFIFPQAALRQIPVYRGEIISLLKNTSIVGYIAIQDLTKMSDIIRSRTYEAFFPLIVTAVIYFILAFIISVILNLVLKAIDPRAKKRNKVKKGGAEA